MKENLKTFERKGVRNRFQRGQKSEMGDRLVIP